MRKLFYVYVILCGFFANASNSTSEDLNTLSTYLSSDIDSAYILSKQYLQKFHDNDDYFGIVRANYYLGYIANLKKNYGKSVIYYLEAIRYAEMTDYESIENDKINLRRNLANIFRSFKANSLATKYNLEGISIAEEEGITNQVITLNRNQGLVYHEAKDFSNAIKCYEKVIELGDDEDKYRTINQIGLVHFDSKDYEQAITIFESIVGLDGDFSRYSAKALHNLGEIHYALGDIDNSIEFLQNSIALKLSLNGVDNYSLFNSYRSIGRYLFEVNEIEKAEEHLLEAEKIFSYAEWDQKSYEIFKTLSNLYYSINNNSLGQKYSELYYNKVQEYLDTQNEIQQQDKEYNFDLITKRYFDEVESQERIASIMQTSKISIGALLSLLLLTIAYHRLEKIRMRRNIEKELTSLKMLD